MKQSSPESAPEVSPKINAKSDARYFARDYDEARSRFTECAERLKKRYPNLSTRAFPVPSKRDKNLFVDYLELPPLNEKETLLVLTSGVHGSEGFTGSAVQLMFLEELIDHLPREKTGLLVTHILNPFGMKYNRRSTENNVNLNRNFGATSDLFKTPNTEYERVAPLLEPKSPAGSVFTMFATTLAFVAETLFIKKFTGDELNRAIAHGQFRHPEGLEYGGKTWEPQIRDFIDQLKQSMVGYKNIVIFDLHTGLGNRYELHLIPVDEPESRDEMLMAKLFDPKKDSQFYKITNPDAEGFYETAGDMNSLPPKIKAPDQRVLTLTFEFGTLGNSTWCKIDSLARVLGENRGFHRGYTSKKNELNAHKNYFNMFTPEETKWRENAIEKSRAVLRGVLEKLKT